MMIIWTTATSSQRDTSTAASVPTYTKKKIKTNHKKRGKSIWWFLFCSYLHSCTPPIIHGNLTCDTIFIQHNGLVKIGSGKKNITKTSKTKKKKKSDRCGNIFKIGNFLKRNMYKILIISLPLFLCVFHFSIIFIYLLK